MGKIVDNRRLLAALEKKRLGAKLDRSERSIINQYLRAEETKRRAETFAAIRKGEWVKWSGRQIKVLQDQAKKHGAPIGGPTIDLPAFVRWFHEFLADNRYRLAVTGGSDGSATEEYKREMAKLTRVRREKLQDRLVPAEEVLDIMTAWGELSRRFGDRLAKIPQAGAEAHRMYEDYRVECDRLLTGAKMLKREEEE